MNCYLKLNHAKKFLVCLDQPNLGCGPACPVVWEGAPIPMVLSSMQPDAARRTTLLPSCSPCCDSSVEQLRKRAARSQIECSDRALPLKREIIRLAHLRVKRGPLGKALGRKTSRGESNDSPLLVWVRPCVLWSMQSFKSVIGGLLAIC